MRKMRNLGDTHLQSFLQVSLEDLDFFFFFNHSFLGCICVWAVGSDGASLWIGSMDLTAFFPSLSCSTPWSYGVFPPKEYYLYIYCLGLQST